MVLGTFTFLHEALTSRGLVFLFCFTPQSQFGTQSLMITFMHSLGEYACVPTIRHVPNAFGIGSRKSI